MRKLRRASEKLYTRNQVLLRRITQGYADRSFHYADIHSFRKNTLDLVRPKFFITQNYAGQKSHYADLRRTYVHYAEDLPRKSYIFQSGNRGLVVAEVLIKYFILGIYHNRPYIHVYPIKPTCICHS